MEFESLEHREYPAPENGVWTGNVWPNFLRERDNWYSAIPVGSKRQNTSYRASDQSRHTLLTIEGYRLQMDWLSYFLVYDLGHGAANLHDLPLHSSGIGERFGYWRAS